VTGDDATPAKTSEDVFRRLLPFLVASDVAILFFVVVAGFALPDRWNGVYLYWGIALGVVAAANQLSQWRIMPKLTPLTDAQLTRIRSRSALRQKVNAGNMLVVSVVGGALSAILDNFVPVSIVTTLVVLTAAITYIIIPMMNQRIRKRGSGDPQ
jgi:heme O synthase-like polyprenyltransferase